MHYSLPRRTYPTAQPDADALIEAVDGCVSRFDVNSLDENYEALASFGELHKDRSVYEIEGKGYLKRSIYVIYALCVQDQYTEASNLLRHAIRFSDLKKTDPIAKNLNVLRAQIASSQRQYDNMKIPLQRCVRMRVIQWPMRR